MAAAPGLALLTFQSKQLTGKRAIEIGRPLFMTGRGMDSIFAVPACEHARMFTLNRKNTVVTIESLPLPG